MFSYSSLASMNQEADSRLREPVTDACSSDAVVGDQYVP